MFLFKRKVNVTGDDEKDIYITVCFYLNENIFKKGDGFSKIYITVCFYSNRLIQ